MGPRSRRSSTSWLGLPPRVRTSSSPQRASPCSTTTARCGVRRPLYIQLDFIVRRLAEKAAADASLAEQQPYKAAVSGDLSWFGGAITKHYQGDDTDLKVLTGAVMSLHESMNVEDHAARVSAFFAEAKHPTLGRPYLGVHLHADGRVAAVPRGKRLHLLHRVRRRPRLHAADHRDDLRHPAGAGGRQRAGLRFEGNDGHGDLLIKPALDFWDDGPEKPVRIWSRIGRRPILLGGQLQRRRRDAAVLRDGQEPRRSDCWSCTTTPIASSTTRQARNGRWSMPRTTAGPSSA